MGPVPGSVQNVRRHPATVADIERSRLKNEMLNSTCQRPSHRAAAAQQVNDQNYHRDYQQQMDQTAATWKLKPRSHRTRITTKIVQSMFVSSADLRGAENLIRQPVAPMLRGSLRKNGVARGGTAAAGSGPSISPSRFGCKSFPSPKCRPMGRHSKIATGTVTHQRQRICARLLN